MESYIEKLDQLIAIKKKKGYKTTKKESEEFVSAWSELISAENGFSEVAEQYYYEGFIFAGAKPFVQWVLISADKVSALDSLFKGHLFGKDTTLSFKILISTLAQLIIMNPSEKNLVCPVIKRIPSVSKNKENKTIGDGHRITLNYFIKELTKDSVLPVLSELDIKPAFIKSFVEVLDAFLGRLDLTSLSERDAQTIGTINRWLHPNTEAEEAEQKDSIPINDNPDAAKEESPVPANKTERDPLQHFSNPYDQLINMLHEAISLSENLRSESRNTERKCATLQESINSFQRETEALNVQLKNAREKESALEKQLSDRSRQISGLNLQVKSLEDEIRKLNEVIESKDQEIVQRTQMMDALSRDRAKQSDEKMHRLASKLKVEYRDFRDAEGLTMDSDLGENMREQLKNVFAILIKAGITLD